MSRLWSYARSLFSQPAARPPAPPRAVPVAQPVRPTPGGDLKDRARRTAEKIRTWVVAGRLSILPWLDNQTDETQEIRSHYRVMLREPTLFSAIRANVLSVSHQDVQVHPEDPDDPAQQEVARAALWALQKSRGGTPHVAQSVLFGGVIDGWSLSEVVLRKEAETYGPCKGRIAIQAFKAKDSKYLQLVVDAYKNVIGVRAAGFGPVRVFEGADLESFVLYTHFGLFESPIGMSAFRCAYRSYWIKDTSWQLRALFLERQATPALQGTWTTLDQKAALEEALEDLGSRTWLTVPAGALVAPIDMAGRGGAEFASAIADCDKEMLVGVCGAHLPFMEGTTSDPRGDTNVQKEVAQLIQWSLSASLGEAVTRQCLAPWTRLNYGEQMPPPMVTWGAVSEQAMMASAQLDEQLQKIGIALSMKERRGYYGRQQPKDESDVLKPGGGGGQPPPGADGGGGGPPGMPPADEEFGEWDESKYRRDRGRFASKGGGGAGAGKREAAAQARQDSHARVRELIAHPDGLHAGSAAELAGHLKQLTVAQINDVKKSLGIRAGGSKEQLVASVTKQATAILTERQKWGREARKAGIRQQDFFRTHAQIRKLASDHVRSTQRMLSEARNAYARENNGKLLTRSHPAFRGGDPAGIPGLDAIARSLADRYPELLGAHGYEHGDNDSESAARNLYDYLLAGPPRMPAREETYSRTLDLARDYASPGFLSRGDEEELPF